MFSHEISHAYDIESSSGWDYQDMENFIEDNLILFFVLTLYILSVFLTFCSIHGQS
jgi:hypothetical protein